MENKILGYSLIVIGIILIGASLVSGYQVFTGSSDPVAPFSFDSVGIEAASLIGGDLSGEQRQMLQQQLAGQKIEILPAEMINMTSNMIAHLLLMGFVATIGAKLAGIGTLLVRTIVVKVKEDNTTNNGQEKT